MVLVPALAFAQPVPPPPTPPTTPEGSVIEADLDAINDPTDEYCLSYESDPGGDFQWVPCGSGSGTNVQVDTGGNLAAADFQDNTKITFAEAAGVVTALIATSAISATELDEAGVEAGLEAVLDLPDLQGLLAPLTQIDTTACGTNEILEDQGASWACITTPTGGGTVTIEEADASPSVASVDTIQFDQADGFTVTDETGGQVQVDFVLDSVGSGTLAAARIDTAMTTDVELEAKTYCDDEACTIDLAGDTITQATATQRPSTPSTPQALRSWQAKQAARF
jgi:hypothetical protein